MENTICIFYLKEKDVFYLFHLNCKLFFFLKEIAKKCVGTGSLEIYFHRMRKTFAKKSSLGKGKGGKGEGGSGGGVL
jgi:hypothetical protein